MGRARFDMTSGDGTVFTNRFDHLGVVSGRRLVMDHGSDAVELGLQTMQKLARHLGVA